MEPDAYRQASQATWEAMAEGWEEWRSTLEEDAAPVREWLVQALVAKPGDTVLELSAAAGDTGFAVASTLGKDGRLISSDFAVDMVELARRRGGELGLENVDYRVIDAESIELEDDSVDGVLCRWGYMLMADPAAALSETRRVLRPGGRLAFSVFGPPERNPWAGVPARALAARGWMPPPVPEAPGIFSMASEERIRALLQVAGFEHVEIDELPVRFHFRDFAEYMRWARDTAGGLAIALRKLAEHERESIEAEVEESFAPFAQAGGYELPGLTLNAVAS
jgi:ubiquinone/menaquinone biosynthesis C-methylase UbiE